MSSSKDCSDTNIATDIQRYRTDLTGFAEQDQPGLCPSCSRDMMWATDEAGKYQVDTPERLGWGEYPKGGPRAKAKPGLKYGIGWECSECGCKSAHHLDVKAINDMYWGINLWRQLNNE